MTDQQFHQLLEDLGRLGIAPALVGAVSVLLVQVIGKLWDLDKQSKHTTYLALQLTIHFESLADAMFNKIIEQEDAEYELRASSFNPSEIISRPGIQNPFSIPELPKSNDYQLLDKKLLIKIMEFYKEKFDSSYFSWRIRNFDNDEILDEIIKTMLSTIRDAINLADKIQEKYKLPTKPYSIKITPLKDEIENRLKKFE